MAGGEEPFLAERPNFCYLSMYALAPNTFLVPLIVLLEPLGELASDGNPICRSSLMFLCGVTEVMKALVDLMPSV